MKWRLENVQWNGKRFVGYVYIGSGIRSDCLPKAKEALVFILVVLNSRWKIPVGYFLLNGLSAVEKASLVKECLTIINECGVRVSLTFDGTSTNFAMSSTIGASLSYPNSKPWFTHPVSNEKVHLMLDPCHMIELIRNTLADWDELIHNEGSTIKWEYFKKMEVLHAGNKLSRRDLLNFNREIMKVKPAVQVFSATTAVALKFL